MTEIKKILRLSRVTKTFGDIVAVHDISFDITDGEFIFITGPSGSGKTTLLRLIMRDLLPDSGQIIIGGADITTMAKKDVPYLRQKIGTVFQDFKVLPERTVRENVEVALAVIGVPAGEWDARVNQVLKLVGLLNRGHLFPAQLSGGELQRASLARALVVNPRVILADEPTGNLDWETADSIMDLFERINQEGKTIIMATHHQGIIDKMKKRVVGLRSGKVVSDSGKVEKVKKTKKEKPKNE